MGFILNNELFLIEWSFFASDASNPIYSHKCKVLWIWFGNRRHKNCFFLDKRQLIKSEPIHVYQQNSFFRLVQKVWKLHCILVLTSTHTLQALHPLKRLPGTVLSYLITSGYFKKCLKTVIGMGEVDPPLSSLIFKWKNKKKKILEVNVTSRGGFS